MAVAVGLDHLSLAAAKLPEPSGTIKFPRVERTTVEPLVVLDAHKQSFLLDQLFDGHSLSIAEYQRLDGEHVVIVLQRRADHLVVHMVGHGHHHHAVRWQRSQRVEVNFRVHVLRRRV